MFTLTTSSSSRKQILLTTAVAIALGATRAAIGATFTNNAGFGGSLWNLGANWNPTSVPDSTTIAYIPATFTNADGNLYITNTGAGSLSPSASVGVLVVNSAPGAVGTIRASNSTSPSTARDAVLTFGSASVGGGLIFDPAESGVLNIGANTDDDGVLTLDVPRSLTFVGPGALNIEFFKARIIGAGSVSFLNVSTTTLQIYQLNGTATGSSTFSGGSTIGPLTEVIVYRPWTGGATPKGPLGTGTVHLNGGTLHLTSAADTLGNAINVIAHSTLDTPIGVNLPGSLKTNGNRLSIRNGGTVTFDNTIFHATDTGTIAFPSLPDSTASHFVVNSGTSTYGGAIGEITDTTLLHLRQRIIKTGSGTLEVKHFRTKTLEIMSGAVRVLPSGTNQVGDDSGVSRLNEIHFDNNSAPSTILDLENNDLVLSWKDVDPIGSLSSATSGGGIARLIQTAFNNDDALGTPR